jgi:hypothetical protein
MITAPHPSPSPSIHLHLPASLKHVHLSPGLIVVAVIVLGLLFVVSRLVRRRRSTEGDSSGGWGNLTIGQDVAVLLLSAVAMGGLAFLLSPGVFIGLSVLICTGCLAFVIAKLNAARPLVQKWQRTVDKDGNEGWRELFSVGPHGPQ